MTLKEEMEEALEAGKTFIPPYKLNEMMKVAGKIIKTLTENASSVTFGYEDMKVIMKIVDSTLEEHLQDKQA